MKRLLQLILISFSCSAFAEENALGRALNERWFECHEAIYKNNFMGEPLLEDGVDIPDTEHELRKKFFTVPDDAVEKFVIGKDGQAAYAVYREKILCAGKTMHGYCGSGGCTRDLVINNRIYELFGGAPFLVQAKNRPVILVGRSGSNCNAHPNAAPCIQAFVWDADAQTLNTMGGHERPVR